MPWWQAINHVAEEKAFSDFGFGICCNISYWISNNWATMWFLTFVHENIGTGYIKIEQFNPISAMVSHTVRSEYTLGQSLRLLIYFPAPDIHDIFVICMQLHSHFIFSINTWKRLQPFFAVCSWHFVSVFRDINQIELKHFCK